MINNGKEEDRFFEEDNLAEDDEFELERAFFRSFIPKERILMLHPIQCKRMILAVKQIASVTNAYLKQYDTKAEYDLRFDSFFGVDALFTVTLPDMGLFLRNQEIRRILRFLPNTVNISITPLLHERASVCITFKDVRVSIDRDQKK